MKRAVFLIIFLLMSGTVFASGPRKAVQYVATDQVVTTSRTVLYDAVIYYVGVTAGDKLELRDGTSTSATAVSTFVAPAAAGTIAYTPADPVAFDTGLYLDSTVSGGAFGISTKLSY